MSNEPVFLVYLPSNRQWGQAVRFPSYRGMLGITCKADNLLSIYHKSCYTLKGMKNKQISVEKMV